MAVKKVIPKDEDILNEINTDDIVIDNGSITSSNVDNNNNDSVIEELIEQNVEELQAKTEKKTESAKYQKNKIDKALKEDEEEKEKESNSFGFISGVLAVVLLIGGSVWFYLKGGFNADLLDFKGQRTETTENRTENREQNNQQRTEQPTEQPTEQNIDLMKW